MGQLTVRKIESLAQPGYYNDGDGLYLIVRPSGAKAWVLRTRVHGKKREIGVGSTKTVGLKDARARGAEMRALARSGGDPLAARQKVIPTFREAAELVHAEQILTGSRNSKHKDQWINTLKTYAYPVIGDRPVDKITQGEILRVLQPIWLGKAETARRVRQRMHKVFPWARTAGHRSEANPVNDIEEGLPRQRTSVRHHPALPWPELPDFMLKLGHIDAMFSLALQFTILTCDRSGETRRATWSEIDPDAKVWAIPAARMKAGKEHRVPLTESALALLERVKGFDETLIFPGARQSSQMSDMTITALLRRMDCGHLTVHGFRSTFRDWVSEATDFFGEIAEHCLAHAVGGAVQRAYANLDMFEKRRRLLEAWEKHAMAEADPT